MAVRDLFNEWRGVQICYKQPAKRFPQVKCHRKEQKNCIKIWSMEDDFAILPTGFWKSMKDQVEELNKIGVAATAIGIDEKAKKNQKEPDCVKICLYGSWHSYICFSVFGVLTICFAEFDTSVICHVVFMLCLGSFLLQNISISIYFIRLQWLITSHKLYILHHKRDTAGDLASSAELF